MYDKYNNALYKCIKISPGEAYKLVQNAIDVLRWTGYNADLDGTTDTSAQHTNPDKTRFYTIGVKTIIKSRSPLELRKALNPVVASFHEVFGHGGQWRNEAKTSTPLSCVLLMNDAACKGSKSYYGINEWNEPLSRRYFEQPHEIAAQYMALKMSQKFLTAVYDEETADKWLCEYVNRRIAFDNEFVSAPDSYKMTAVHGRVLYMRQDEPFISMKQVYKHFQETFTRQVFAPSQYTANGDKNDPVTKYVKSHVLPWTKSRILNDIDSIPNRLVQDYVRAGIWMEQNEEWSWIKELPVFKDIEFPKGISTLIENAPDPPDEKDLDLEQLKEEDIDFDLAVKQLDLKYLGLEQ